MSVKKVDGLSAISCPLSFTYPAVLGIFAVMMLNVVDLPAPFGPSNPNIYPFSTLNVVPLTA